MSAKATSARHFEDFAPGQRFGSASRTVTAHEIVAFATQFDPQPFHLDPQAARHSVFGGLAASGWHTAALTMALALKTGMDPAGGFVGLGAEALRWLRPVRPGDELRLVAEVCGVRVLASRPDAGAVQVAMRTLNQHDESVFTCVGSLLVPRRMVAANRHPVAA